MSKITQLILIAISLTLAISGANAAAIGRLEDYACYGDLQKPLFEGGYSGGDCKNVRRWSKKIGDIVVKGKKFSIYDFQYETIPEPGTAAHGGERLIVIQDDKTYVGQYSLYSLPRRKIHIQGMSVYLDAPKELGNRISFDSGFPPDKAYLDGYVSELYK